MFAVNRQKESHVVGNYCPLKFCFATQYCDLGFQVWWLQIRNQPPFKPGMQTLFNFWYLPRWTVRSEDDLLLTVIQSIKGMKKFLLSALFAGDELNVIN